jgi:hypothetical protein
MHCNARHNSRQLNYSMLKYAGRNRFPSYFPLGRVIVSRSLASRFVWQQTHLYCFDDLKMVL